MNINILFMCFKCALSNNLCHHGTDFYYYIGSLNIHICLFEIIYIYTCKIIKGSLYIIT